jgi:TfoX/Sxy family transcriptional regulator of competence genes
VAYDENTASRLRAELGTLPGLTEKKMFGGIAFMIGGNMACGVIGDDLIVRVGAAQYRVRGFSTSAGSRWPAG